MEYLYRKNIRLKQELAKCDKDRTLGVAIDPSKFFHRVLIFSFRGRLLTQPFSIDTLQQGYQDLLEKVRSLVLPHAIDRVYIGIEHGGSYSDNLYQHLRQDFDRVYFVSANAVAENRKQRLIRGLKTDDVDAGAVGDLLMRGEIIPNRQEKLMYRNLKDLVYWRNKKITLRAVLKNQISYHMDKIYPGINTDFADHKKVFSRLVYDNMTFRGLLASDKHIEQLLRVSDEQLVKDFGYKMPSCGPHQVRKLKSRLQELLVPKVSYVREEQGLLRRDLRIYEAMDAEIREIEERIVTLGKRSHAKYLMGQIRGISDLWAAIYVGLVGDFNRFKTAEQVYSLAGMCPRISTSGQKKSSRLKMKRFGNTQLRGALYMMASQVIINEPLFNAYYKRLRANPDRSWKNNRMAVCRKLNKILFALIRDKVPFEREVAGNSS